MTGDVETILIVEDEVELAELFAAWLTEDYECRIAHNGDEALEAVDDDVDAVLLDRRMPGISGDEVLTRFRDRGIECPIGMVTAVEPDFDIVEMGFDDYIVKPVSRSDLVEFVRNLLSLSGYEQDVKDYFQLAAKRAALESAKNESELQRSEEYQELVAELEAVQQRADNQRDELMEEDPSTALW